MVDIHSHIIPSIDDGATDDNESIEMCKIASNNGFHTIIATPHFIDTPENDDMAVVVKEKVEKLKILLHEHSVKINVLVGMEILASSRLPYLLANGKLLSLNGSRYLLVEFGNDIIPAFVKEMLFNIRVEGYIPVIAHPERNSEFVKNILFIKDLIARGALIQINKGSLQQGAKETVRKAACEMIEKGLVHFVATDAHDLEKRNYDMCDVEEKICKLVGEENAKKLLYTNPEKLMNNEPIEIIDVEKLERKYDKKRRKNRFRVYIASIVGSIVILITIGYYQFNKLVDDSIKSIVQSEQFSAQDIDKLILAFEENAENTANGANSSNSANSANSSKLHDSGYMTQEEILQRQGAVNIDEQFAYGDNAQPAYASDKQRAMSIIYRRLSKDQIERIKEMAVGGLTNDEVARVREILKSALTIEDMREMKGLYSKYAK